MPSAPIAILTHCLQTVPQPKLSANNLQGDICSGQTPRTESKHMKRIIFEDVLFVYNFYSTRFSPETAHSLARGHGGKVYIALYLYAPTRISNFWTTFPIDGFVTSPKNHLCRRQIQLQDIFIILVTCIF